MTDINTLLAEIEAGLEGVTPGPWEGIDYQVLGPKHGIAMLIYGHRTGGIDAAHIARLSPENMRAILDHIRQIKRERDDALIAAALDQKAVTQLLRISDKIRRERDEAIRERDEARAEAVKWRDEQGCACGADDQCRFAKERDEARAVALEEAADLADTTFSCSGTDAARIIRDAIRSLATKAPAP